MLSNSCLSVPKSAALPAVSGCPFSIAKAFAQFSTRCADDGLANAWYSPMAFFRVHLAGEYLGQVSHDFRIRRFGQLLAVCDAEPLERGHGLVFGLLANR